MQDNQKQGIARKLFKKDLVFNIIVGQLIAMSMVSGGVFS
jgi:hypothetical protein